MLTYNRFENLINTNPMIKKNRFNLIECPENNIEFQLVYIDYTSTKVEYDDERQSEKVLTVRLFGCTDKGISVCCRVYNYKPYFYVDVPKDVQSIEEFKSLIADKDLPLYDDNTSDKKKNFTEKRQKILSCIEKIEMIEQQNLMYYNFDEKIKVFKIYTHRPGNVRQCRKLFEQGMVFKHDIEGLKTYESNVLFPLRFMVDKHISGASWVL